MMKFKQTLSGLITSLTLIHALAAAPKEVPLQPGDAAGPGLNVTRTPTGIELAWRSNLLASDRSVIRPAYQVERSTDFVRWEPVGPVLDTAQNPTLVQRIRFDHADAPVFYRVVAKWMALPGEIRPTALGQGGAEVFGYGAAFLDELEALGQIAPDEFAALYAPPDDYVKRISFDPTEARCWPEFMTPPPEKAFDFRLDDRELAVLKQNGFVVSERLATHSFAEMFYRVWMNDLPVFVSSDAILQAWHRSYDMMLEETEEALLSHKLGQILDGMAARIGDAAALAGDGVLSESVRDADYMLTVARSLLEGQIQGSMLGQTLRVGATLDAIALEKLDPCFALFGHPRGMDFSQFKVRGHYENSTRLGRYFKCVMWLGRTDLRVAGKDIQDSACEGKHDADPRELGTATVLHWLLAESGQFDNWQEFDRIIQAYVGWTDSMTFAQLGGLLSSAGVASLTDLPDTLALESLQDLIEQGQLGAQQITSDFYIAPLGNDRIKLPRSFTVFGQKFVPDSWALSKVVFDQILWNGGKIMRRVPSGLDVAFSVLGNDQAVPNIVERMTDTSASANPQRDGFGYQHNLATVRRVLDGQPWDAWQSNIYMDWLGTLRTLSKPLTSDLRLPEAFRTRAWAMKTLNTQLASWTQLRHDTILYAKQSYSPGALCSHPDGYVEPVPAFWRRLRSMADRTAELLDSLSLNGASWVETRGSGFWQGGRPITIDLGSVRDSQVAFLRHFALVCGWLERIAVQELAHQPLAREDLAFINSLIEYHPEGGYSIGVRLFNGWYPSLFYHPSFIESGFFHQDYGADKMDGLVADVHTDLPCGDCFPPDGGSVLHEAVGYVNLLMIAAQRGDETIMFAGPVLSHYEFEVLGPPKRWSDSEWRAGLGWWKEFASAPPTDATRPAWTKRPNRAPPIQPEWTKNYLVPAP